MALRDVDTPTDTLPRIHLGKSDTEQQRRHQADRRAVLEQATTPGNLCSSVQPILEGEFRTKKSPLQERAESISLEGE